MGVRVELPPTCHPVPPSLPSPPLFTGRPWGVHLLPQPSPGPQLYRDAGKHRRHPQGPPALLRPPLNALPLLSAPGSPRTVERDVLAPAAGSAGGCCSRCAVPPASPPPHTASPPTSLHLCFGVLQGPPGDPGPPGPPGAPGRQVSDGANGDQACPAFRKGLKFLSTLFGFRGCQDTTVYRDCPERWETW